MAVVTSTVTALAVLACGALIGLTTLVHRSTSTLSDSVESVRLGEEAHIDLLIYARDERSLSRTAIAADLRRRLQEAEAFVSSAEERAILDAAVARVGTYLTLGATAVAPPEALDAAHDALEALVNVNVVQARRARDEAARWDHIANTLGVATAVLILLVAAFFVWWVKSRAFYPIVKLAAAMDRFRDDHAARAEESGPAEMRGIARHFNTMAESLSTQRHNQLAFIGGVAHDLRNPLQALHLSLAQLDPELPMPTEARVRRVIERSMRQVTRLDRMIDDLLDTARLEAGQLDLRLEETDAREVLRETIDQFEVISPPHDLVLDLPRTPVLVRCDPIRLEQAVANLIGNAIKYSVPGGRIAVSARGGSDETVIAVTDDGPGIPEQEQREIFEPFHRAAGRNKSVPGSGLGLFVVRRIAEAHGGHVDVHSAPGTGSTFTIRIPASPVEVAGP